MAAQAFEAGDFLNIFPDKVKKFNSIFISIQLSEMDGSLRVKFLGFLKLIFL